MAEFGNQYNSLQGFSYSITAVINALAQINNTLSTNNGSQNVYFDPVGSTIQNTGSTAQTYYLNNWTNCLKSVGFVLQSSRTNTNPVVINNSIILEPGSVFALTVEQNRLFNLNNVHVTIQPNDSIGFLPICVQ
jgi:hypothetical protein